MNRMRLWAIMVVATLCAGCGLGQAKFTTTSDGRYIPEGLGDNLPPAGEVAPNARVRTDGVYVMGPKTPDGKIKLNRYWANGRTLSIYRALGRDGQIKAADADNFEGGHVGRYTQSGASIAEEFWEADSGAMRWVFVQCGGWVEANRIVWTTFRRDVGRPSETNVERINAVYEFREVPGMTRHPDW